MDKFDELDRRLADAPRVIKEGMMELKSIEQEFYSSPEYKRMEEAFKELKEKTGLSI